MSRDEQLKLEHSTLIEQYRSLTSTPIWDFRRSGEWIERGCELACQAIGAWRSRDKPSLWRELLESRLQGYSGSGLKKLSSSEGQNARQTQLLSSSLVAER